MRDGRGKGEELEALLFFSKPSPSANPSRSGLKHVSLTSEYMKGFVFILLIASAAADKNALRARREADRIAHEKAVAEEAAKAAHEAMLSNQAKADAALIAAHLVEQQKLRDATAARLSKPFQNKVRADYSNTYFSNSLSSSDSHGPVEYRVMPVGTPNMCLAVPKADSKSGLRNGDHSCKLS